MAPCAISGILFFTIWQLTLTNLSLEHTKYTLATYISDWILAILILILMVFIFKKILHPEKKILEEFNGIAENLVKFEDSLLANKTNSRDIIPSLSPLMISNDVNC
jgi:hypothetical protein